MPNPIKKLEHHFSEDHHCRFLLSRLLSLVAIPYKKEMHLHTKQITLYTQLLTKFFSNSILMLPIFSLRFFSMLYEFQFHQSSAKYQGKLYRMPEPLTNQKPTTKPAHKERVLNCSQQEACRHVEILTYSPNPR